MGSALIWKGLEVRPFQLFQNVTFSPRYTLTPFNIKLIADKITTVRVFCFNIKNKYNIFCVLFKYFRNRIHKFYLTIVYIWKKTQKLNIFFSKQWTICDLGPHSPKSLLTPPTRLLLFVQYCHMGYKNMFFTMIIFMVHWGHNFPGPFHICYSDPGVHVHTLYNLRRGDVRYMHLFDLAPKWLCPSNNQSSENKKFNSVFWVALLFIKYTNELKPTYISKIIIKWYNF